MVKMIITDKMIHRARKRDQSRKYNNSVTDNKSRLFGFLGEEISLAFLKNSKLVNNFDYDILWHNIKIDVKTGKTKVTPNPDFMEVSIYDINTTQQTDYYLFTRIHQNSKEGWILGWLRKDEFFKRAFFRKKGELIEKSNYTYLHDSHNVWMNQLDKVGLVRL